MKETLQVGVVGTGGISTDFVEALGRSTRCRVVNVTGSKPEAARAFAARWNIPAASASLAQMLADKAVELVYIGTPHPFHEQQALASIAAGKHVLCEKPLALTAGAAERMISAARAGGVFLMEGYMYRCHPLLKHLIARLQEGIIGRMRHVRADFGFRVPRNPDGRHFARSLGGGGILDVGGYVVSFARLMAGMVEGGQFAEPIRLSANGVIGPAGADEIASALLTFQSGFTASVTAAVFHDTGTQTVIFGESGKIVLPNPWIPNGKRQSLEASYTVLRDGHQPETETIRTDMSTYAIEAELVADSLPAQEAKWPAMSWADSLGNMRVLEAWLGALGSP